MTDGYKIKRVLIWQNNVEKQIRPNNILLYMPMNSDLLDHSGNNIAVTNTGVTLASNVISGRNVAYFAGTSTNNYLIFDLGAFPTKCTVSFWLKTTDTKGSYFSSYYFGGADDKYINLQAENTGSYFSCIVFNNNRMNTTTTPFNGVWHNIVLTRDGTNKKLYMDKTLLCQAVYTMGVPISQFNFGGAPWDGAGWAYGGYMAEAKLLNIAWEQTDVNSNYDSEKSIFGIS